MTTKITENNLEVIANTLINWQSVITAAGGSSTAVAGRGYIINTTSNTHTLNLPSSPSIGDTVVVKDYAGTFGTNNLTIGRNGENIQGVANDSLISTNRASVTLVYVDGTRGWVYTNESNVADLEAVAFITATGGIEQTLKFAGVKDLGELLKKLGLDFSSGSGMTDTYVDEYETP